MRTHQLATWTLAFAAAVALTATAWAGDAVRLLVEPPKDTTTVEAGDPAIDVQIVGQDAAGGRVGPAGKTVEVSATNGDLVLVEAPYKYRYTPPATVDQATPVKLRAWFKQNPDINGEANLTLVPHRPYERLVLVAKTTAIELGKSMTIEVRGVKADGSSAAVAGEVVKMTGDGVGTVETVAASVFRYNAPAKSETKLVGATAHLRAYLERYPKVAGDLSIVLSADAPPDAPGGGGTQPPAPGNPPPTPTPPPTPQPGPGTKPGDDVPGVVWPGGDVKVLVWRAKSRDPKDDWNNAKKRALPPAGKSFSAPLPLQFLRVEILRDDVRKIEVEWYVDKKSAAVHTDDSDKEGRLRKEVKSGRTHAVLTMETPEDGKMLVVDLLLTTAKGEILKEEFLMQRGHDRDNDGEKDRKK